MTDQSAPEEATFQRGVLGVPGERFPNGDAMQRIFVLQRLMACVDIDEDWSRGDGYLRRAPRGPGDAAPGTYWVGVAGNDPNVAAAWEVLVLRERGPGIVTGGGLFVPRIELGEPSPTMLRLVCRVLIENPNDIRLIEALDDVVRSYQPAAVAFDYSVENPLPALWPEKDDSPLLGVDLDEVRAAGTDLAVALVDARRLEIPYDKDLLNQFNGQVCRLSPDGQREYTQGRFGALDALRVALLARERTLVSPYDVIVQALVELRSLAREGTNWGTAAEDKYQRALGAIAVLRDTASS